MFTNESLDDSPTVETSHLGTGDQAAFDDFNFNTDKTEEDD